MNLKIYQVDAFTDQVFGGNPAAVCPLETWLDEPAMQKIAMENNLSETAYFVKNGNEFDIRWFTPTAEIDLCGHATLASAFVIYEFLNYDKEKVVFNYGGGQLTVKKNGDLLEMDFPSSMPVEVAEPQGLSEAIGAKPKRILKARDYVLVYEDEETIKNMRPDFKALTKIDASTFSAFVVTAPGKNSDFVSRVFAPKIGIDEDPVTGSTHTELIPYWANTLSKTKMEALQLSKRGGRIKCELLGDRVAISGRAVTYLVGEVFF